VEGGEKMSHTLRQLLIAASLVVGCFVAGHLSTAIADEPTDDAPPDHQASDHQVAVLNRILANWKARQERIRSFHCRFVTCDSRLKSLKRAGEPVADFQLEMWLDRSNDFRIVESSLPVEHPKTSSLALHRPAKRGRLAAYACDRSETWQLVANAHASRGIVWGGKFQNKLADRSIFPLLLAFRPYPSDLVDPLSKAWRVVHENSILQNTHGVKLQSIRQGVADTCWVDPARDDLIFGWKSRRGQHPTTFVLIEYEHDKQNGWIPARWNYTVESSHEGEKVENTMSSCTINESFSQETFTLALPPGTKVLDQRLMKTYEIAADGSKTNATEYVAKETLKISETLELPVDFTVEPEPLKEALAFIAARYQIEVTLDAKAGRQGLIDPDIEVATGTAGIELRDMLKLLLDQSRKPLYLSSRRLLLAKSLAIGCVITGVISTAIAADPPPPALELPISGPIGLANFSKEFVPHPVAAEAPVGPPSEKESRVLDRILAAWRARQQRIHSFFIAWDFRSVHRDDTNAGPPDSHTELWMDQDFRCRVLTSSPPNYKPIEHTFDGMTTVRGIPLPSMEEFGMAHLTPGWTACRQPCGGSQSNRCHVVSSSPRHRK
jgi:hypothetical protein